MHITNKNPSFINTCHGNKLHYLKKNMYEVKTKHLQPSFYEHPCFQQPRKKRK